MTTTISKAQQLQETGYEPFGVHIIRCKTKLPAAVLAGRLNTGERMIESETDSKKREQLIDFWIELLHRYERAFDAEHSQEAA